MDFDFSHIAVPFRMQPGLRRLAAGTPQLTRLDPASALWAEKRAVLAGGQSRHSVPGFDPAPALQAIAAEAAGLGAEATGVPLELAFEEDFAVLDGATSALPWLCVCVPSHWAPEEKVGLDFHRLHAPVADSAVLLAASAQLVALATGGERWERFVWTLSPSPRFDQHPARHARTPWPETGDPARLAAGTWLRAERQTFFPVGRGTRQAVFTIRVMLEPLERAIDSAEKAQRLHGALASMSEAVLQYKGLAPARSRLLAWLASRTA